ncbi:hypothetical protein ACHWQZ_G010881 [Mnemiopsis leidyi]
MFQSTVSIFPADSQVEGNISRDRFYRYRSFKIKMPLSPVMISSIHLSEEQSNISGAADLETQICSADVENKCLLKEKVEDQRTIIKLQSQLIEKEQESVQSFKETVQNEVKSYAGVVASSCATALSPKKTTNCSESY